MATNLPPGFQSQLCQEESWERIYYPPDTDPLRPPFAINPRSEENFCAAMKERIHSRYCDFKDRCMAGYALCKGTSNCSCSSIYHKYFHWSKAVVLILVMNALFSSGIYEVLSKLLQIVLGPNHTLAPVVVTYGMVQLLFPAVGHISDVYVCRQSVIRFGIWSAWISLALLGVSLSVDSQKDSLNAVNQYAVLPTIFVALSVSYVCFVSNVIPFALDQMQGASHVHYTSFFYWWYWTLNVGTAVVHTPKYCIDEPELRYLIRVEIALLCITGALVLNVMFQHWLVVEPQNSKSAENPVLQMCRVLRYALKAPSNQRVPSSVQHELDLSSCNCLQLAKKRFGGNFETEHVENTRTFLYVVFVLVSVGFVLVPYFGVSYKSEAI